MAVHRYLLSFLSRLGGMTGFFEVTSHDLALGKWNYRENGREHKHAASVRNYRGNGPPIRNYRENGQENFIYKGIFDFAIIPCMLQVSQAARLQNDAVQTHNTCCVVRCLL